MTASWTFVICAVLSILLAAALAQRELFSRGRQIELRDQDIQRLHNEVEQRDRRLEAEEILLKRAGQALMLRNSMGDK